MSIKGFRPTGYGPKSGFSFSSSQGFTGSTGQVTNVSGYARRKGYAKGGFVKEGYQPKVERVGDSGHATVHRNKPTTSLDQESGGRSPLRPGFKKGGKAHMFGGGALRTAIGAAAARARPPAAAGMKPPDRAQVAPAVGAPMRRPIKRGDGGKVAGFAKFVKSAMSKAKVPEKPAASASASPPPSAGNKPRADVTDYGYLDRRSGERKYFRSPELRDSALKRRSDVEGVAFFAPIDSGTIREKRSGGAVKMRKC